MKKIVCETNESLFVRATMWKRLRAYFFIISIWLHHISLLEIVLSQPVGIEELTGIGCLGLDAALRQEHGAVNP